MAGGSGESELRGEKALKGQADDVRERQAELKLEYGSTKEEEAGIEITKLVPGAK